MADKKPTRNDSGNQGGQRGPGGPGSPGGPTGGNWLSRGWFWIVLVILLVVGSRYLFNGSTDSADQVGLNVLASQVQAGKVKSLVVQGDTVTIIPIEGSRSYTRQGRG